MSKEFVEYHSDGACYADGTLPIISKNVGCYNPKTYLFWKHPADVTDKVNTRLQLQQKRHVTPSYITSYYTLLFNRMKKYSTKQEIDVFKEQKITFFEEPKVNYSKPEDVKSNDIINTYLNVNDMLKPNIDCSNEDKIRNSCQIQIRDSYPLTSHCNT